MASVTTNDLRITNAKNFVRYLTTGDPSYMFIGRPTPWNTNIEVPQPRVSAGDNSPPYPENNWKDFYTIWDQMLAMNRIQPNEVYHMIPRIPYTSGVVYDMYRHDYNEYVRSHSNAKNLFDALFCVISQNNNVYACLFNNELVPSTVEPLAESDEPFYTSDGYQWIRLYQLDSSFLLDHSTNNFIPVMNSRVNRAPAGEIYTVVVDARGDDYTSMPRGVNNNIPHYYCRILGDGEGAVARVTVAGGVITDVKVSRHGSGYTYGKLDFVANRVYETLNDLDEHRNGLNPGGDGAFRSTVIIGPPGGWGRDLIRQLGATRVGIFSDFKTTNADYVTQSEFRQVGVMSGIDNLTDSFPESFSMVYGVKVSEITGSMNVDYSMYETITQTYTDETDPRIRYVAKGQVVGWDDVNGIIRYIQDPKLHSDDQGQLYRFRGNAPIIGETTEKQTIPNVDYSEELEGLVFEFGYSQPEARKYVGVLDYVTNLSPIKRAPNQSERVSLIVSY